MSINMTILLLTLYHLRQPAFKGIAGRYGGRLKVPVHFLITEVTIHIAASHINLLTLNNRLKQIYRSD